MNSIYQKKHGNKGLTQYIRCNAWTMNKYLYIEPKTPSFLSNFIDATKEDFIIQNWDGNDIYYPLKHLFTPKQKKSLLDGNKIGILVPREFVSARIVDNIEQRKHRLILIDRASLAIRQMKKQDTAEDQAVTKNKQQDLSSGLDKQKTIDYLDGSLKLWLTVLVMAKKDFLENCTKINRWSDEDFLSAYGFLFRDDFTIPFGGTEEAPGEINLRELLNLLIEVCEIRDLSFPASENSIETLRANLAEASGDPRLIKKYVS